MPTIELVEEPPLRGAHDAATRSILVVDDHPVDRRMAARIIELEPGFRAVYATDGEQAIRLVEQDPPAAVLTDLQMPGLDGFGLVERIRDIDEQLPVILMTGQGSEEIALRSLQAGAASYVPKRKLISELPETLHKVLAFAAAGRKRRRLLGAMQARSSRFELENDPQLIAPLVELFQEDLAEMGLGSGASLMHVGVALQEALLNSLYHGNLGVSSDLRQEEERLFFEEVERRRLLEPFRSRSIRVEVVLDRESATYQIRDEGDGFDTTTLDRPIDPEDLLRVGGRGLLLIRSFMDEVRYNEVGNEVTLVKRRRTASADRT